MYVQHEQLERDLQQVVDEKEELVTERDVYRLKYDRLNKELHYILKGDERRVLDVDALIMENRFHFVLRGAIWHPAWKIYHSSSLNNNNTRKITESVQPPPRRPLEFQSHVQTRESIQGIETWHF